LWQSFVALLHTTVKYLSLSVFKRFIDVQMTVHALRNDLCN